MIGRVFLFVLTNILVITTVSIIVNLLGIGSYMEAEGINYMALMVFCLIWGMVGSFISLALSRWMAKRLLKVQVIDLGSAGQHDWLVNMVHDLAKRANLPKMPEVGVYQSDDVNAFATGPSKSRSLVAFSTGILASMNRNEIEGVTAHEIAHIQNGDMVTMTLIQGIINAFVMFFARVVAHLISQSVREEFSYIAWIITVIVSQIVFGILGSLVTAWFSRKREFRADAGSASLAGTPQMVAALEALQKGVNMRHEQKMPASMAALGISSKASFAALWSTHPPLAKRIEALKQHA